jgi:hypothetical protein
MQITLYAVQARVSEFEPEFFASQFAANERVKELEKCGAKVDVTARAFDSDAYLDIAKWAADQAALWS